MKTTSTSIWSSKEQSRNAEANAKRVIKATNETQIGIGIHIIFTHSLKRKPPPLQFGLQ